MNSMRGLPAMMRSLRSRSVRRSKPAARIGLALFFSMMAAASVARAQDAGAQCDLLAAAPTDLQRPDGIVGVPFETLEADSGPAIAACQSATTSDPTNPRLQFELGRSLDAAKRYDEALDWYKKAASLDYSQAMANIGHYYQNVAGANQDASIAKNWYEKAAELGNSAGMTDLGNLYSDGIGVAKDLSVAKSLYAKAALLGDAQAMATLGYLQDTGGDFAAAKTWYEKAATLGNAEAMNNLGTLYERGAGVPRDLLEAKNWYEKAADLGFSAAKDNTIRLNPPDSPSQEDTIKSIEDIYNNQADCSTESIGAFMEFINDSDFRFSEKGGGVEFYSTFEIILGPSSREKTRWVGSFDPADIVTYKVYSQEGNQPGTVWLLEIDCANSQECIYDGSNMRAVDSYSIHFCDREKIDRVVKALVYLKKFYHPSKKDPF